MIWSSVFAGLFVLTLFSLPWVWLAAWVIDGRRRSTYLVSLIYLLLSWMMIAIAFALFIDRWSDLMSLSPFFVEEVAKSPPWARFSYALFDRFFELLPSDYLIVISSLPALLIPFVRLTHFRHRYQEALAFQYATFNIAYFFLAIIASGPTLIVATYVLLGSYVLLLLTHWFVRPTPDWTERIWATPQALSERAIR